MASDPIFAVTPNLGTAQITAATTVRDGTGSLVTAFTAGANGSRVDRITVTATVTTAAGSIMIFVSDGTVTRLLREIPVLATTASTTAVAWVGQLPIALTLKPGWTIKAGATVATGQPFNVLVEGADF